LATTLLAGLGVVLALLSLAWQAWSFTRSGSRVSVTIYGSLRGGMGGGAMTVPNRAPAAVLQQMHAQGFSKPAVAIEVRNAGRGPTSIVKLVVLLGNGATWTDAALDPTLPFRLDGESEQTWLVDAPIFIAAARAAEQTKQGAIRARVWIGGREKPIESKNSINLP
jgi:hypothetical protein